MSEGIESSPVPEPRPPWAVMRGGLWSCRDCLGEWSVFRIQDRGWDGVPHHASCPHADTMQPNHKGLEYLIWLVPTDNVGSAGAIGAFPNPVAARSYMADYPERPTYDLVLYCIRPGEEPRKVERWAD